MTMTLTTKLLLTLLITSVLFGVSLFLGFYVQPAQPAQGSTNSEASDYQATSTAASNVYGAFTTGQTLKRGPGSFGSVIITGANTGVLNFYDATTTDVNKRTGQTATSTILVASIPASMAVGTYTFDAALKYGLLLELVSGSMPTSTITTR